MFANTQSQLARLPKGSALLAYYKARTSALTATACTPSGSNAVLTISGSPNLTTDVTNGVIQAGQVLTLSSFANAANNGDFEVISVDEGADTITVNNSVAVSETGATALVAVKHISTNPALVEPASKVLAKTNDTVANVYDAVQEFFTTQTNENGVIQVVVHSGTSVDVTIEMSLDQVNWDTLLTAISSSTVTSSESFVLPFDDYPTGTYFKITVNGLTGSPTYSVRRAGVL